MTSGDLEGFVRDVTTHVLADGHLGVTDDDFRGAEGASALLPKKGRGTTRQALHQRPPPTPFPSTPYHVASS